MKDRLLALAQRIQGESDDYYLDGVALNLHGFQFDPSRVQRLVQQVPAVLERLRPELLAFADFLQERTTEADSKPAP